MCQNQRSGALIQIMRVDGKGEAKLGALLDTESRTFYTANATEGSAS